MRTLIKKIKDKTEQKYNQCPQRSYYPLGIIRFTREYPEKTRKQCKKEHCTSTI